MYYNTAIGFLISAYAISSYWNQWESYGIDGHKSAKKKKTALVKPKEATPWGKTWLIAKQDAQVFIAHTKEIQE